MSITAELENIQELESVGFTHEQAKVLTKTIERSHVDAQEGLKEFIRQQNKELRNEFKQDIKDLEVHISQTEVRLLESQRDLMIKFITIVTAIVGIATAIIKLF